MLQMRDDHGIATGELLSVPKSSDPAVLTLVNRLAIGAVQVSVFNFSEREIAATVSSKRLQHWGKVVDLAMDEIVGKVSPHPVKRKRGTFDVDLAPFGFRAFIIKDADWSE